METQSFGQLLKRFREEAGGKIKGARISLQAACRSRSRIKAKITSASMPDTPRSPLARRRRESDRGGR
jgi:hypothetical protein